MSTSIVVKNIIDEQELDLTFSNQFIYASTVISRKLCNAKIKATKRNVPKNRAWQEHIQKIINVLCSNLEKLKKLQNNNNVKISKSRKLRTNSKIEGPE